MALPLKSGADFYMNEARRLVLHNLGVDLDDEVGIQASAGFIYFNSESKAIRYCYGLGGATGSVPLYHQLATIKDLENLDAAINTAMQSLSSRVGVNEGKILALEGLFNGSNAKVADNALKLGGQLPSYYAQTSVVSQLRSEFDALYKTLNDDTAGVIDTWQEVVDFVNEYSGSEDLSTILAGMNTQIADRYTKAEANNRYLKLTGGTVNGVVKIKSTTTGEAAPLRIITTDTDSSTLRFSTKNSFIFFGFNETNGLFVTNVGGWSNNYAILHAGNYSDLIKTLNKTLSVPKVLVGGAKENTDYRLNVLGGIRADSTEGHAVRLNNGNVSLSLIGSTTGAVAKGLYFNFDNTCVGGLVALHSKGVFQHLYLGDNTNYPWFTINATKANFAVPTSLSAGASIPTGKSLTIGSITLTDDNGILKIDGSAYATGELSAGGAGEDGGTGGSGVIILEDWGDYDSASSQVVGAALGLGLKESLDSAWEQISNLNTKSTNVQFTPTLASGKQIGAITIDGVTTNLFAPSSYAWSEITSKPTTLAGYGITDAIKADGSTPLVGSLTISSASDKKIVLNNTDEDDKYQFILFCQKGVEYGSLGTTGDDNLKWSNNTLLHSGNVGEYALKTDGSNAMAKDKYIDWEGSGQNGEDYESFGYGIRILSYDVASSNYRGGLSVGTRYGFQLTRLANDDVGSLTVRFNDPNNGNTWGDWKTIAFTDSDITGYAAGLKHSNGKVGAILNASSNVTIGASDLAGTDYKLYVNGKGLFTNTITANAGINLANRTYIRGMLTDGTTNARLLGINQADEFLVGYGVMTAAQTSVYGKSITMHANGEAASFRINEYGNVTLGVSTDKATDAYGLYVGKALPSYFANRVLIGGTDDGSTGFQVNGTSAFGGQSTFNALALFNKSIVAKDTLQIGEATLTWDADRNALKVDKNIYSDGEVSAGGAAEEGEGGTTGGTGSANKVVKELTAGGESYTIGVSEGFNLGTSDVIVNVYEKNSNVAGQWDMILTDVEVHDTKVVVKFGHATAVDHKVVIIG